MKPRERAFKQFKSPVLNVLTHKRFLTSSTLNYLNVALSRNVSLELSIYLVLVRHCPLQSFPTGIPPTLSSCHLQLNTKPGYSLYIKTSSLQQRRYVTSAFPRSPTYRTRKFDRFLNPFYVIPLHSLARLNFSDVFIRRTLKSINIHLICI